MKKTLKIILYIGFIGAFASGALGFMGHIELAKTLIPVFMLAAVIGMIVPALIKPNNEYDYGTGLGIKLCFGSALIIAVPFLVDLIVRGPGPHNIGGALSGYVSPVFIIGFIIIVYKASTNGAFK